MGSRQSTWAMVMADRPVRKVSEVKTDDLVTKLRAMFSSGSEDFPNAVLSGGVRGGGMKEVALVLVGASYSGEGPSLTLKWRATMRASQKTWSLTLRAWSSTA